MNKNEKKMKRVPKKRSFWQFPRSILKAKEGKNPKTKKKRKKTEKKMKKMKKP
jgi:hypothetical protein